MTNARTYFYAGYSDSTSTGFHHRSDALGACIKHMDADTVKHGDRNRFVVQVDVCAYAPDRANDKRGTLARFLLVNELVVVHGVMPATVVARIAAERAAAAGTFDTVDATRAAREAATEILFAEDSTPAERDAACDALESFDTADETRDDRITAWEAAEAATAVLLPYGAVLVDMLATVANRDHLRLCGNPPIGNGACVDDCDDDACHGHCGEDLVDVDGTATLASIGANVDDDADLTPAERRADRIARRRYRLAAAGAIDVSTI